MNESFFGSLCGQESKSVVFQIVNRHPRSVDLQSELPAVIRSGHFLIQHVLLQNLLLVCQFIPFSVRTITFNYCSFSRDLISDGTAPCLYTLPKKIGLFVFPLIYYLFMSSHLDIFFFIAFRESGREREKHQRERETLIGCLLHLPGLGDRARTGGSSTPRPGIESATQVCALTGNRTCNPLVTGQCSNQLSHSRQGFVFSFR